MLSPPFGSESLVAELEAAATKLQQASAPLLTAITRAQPLINAETLTSREADRWSAEWQAKAAAVVRLLSYTLPDEAQAAVSAAQNAAAAAAAAQAKAAAAAQAKAAAAQAKAAAAAQASYNAAIANGVAPVPASGSHPTPR